MILAGHARCAAAKLLGTETVPTICVTGLDKDLLRAFALADNKFAERARWERELLAAELKELSIVLPALDLDLSIAGFEPAEIDMLFADLGEKRIEPEDRFPPTAGPVVSRPGDVSISREHRVLCGDARDLAQVDRLMQGELAAAVFTDPPYNVPIHGHARGRGRVKHRDFALASGEMTDAEFGGFLGTCLGAAARVSRDGAVHFVCMDWRHVETLLRVARAVYCQSALKFDPVSASKIDPPVARVVTEGGRSPTGVAMRAAA